MAITRVRVFDKPTRVLPPATWIGLSANACAIEHDAGEAWPTFFAERGYSVRQVNPDDTLDLLYIQEIGSPSYGHYEVRPPMSTEHLRELGKLCARYIDTGHNDGYLIDNRETELPIHGFDTRGTIIASW